MLAPDLVPAGIVAAAIAPALLMLWLVVAADSRPEPPRVVLGAVLLGALCAIAAAFLERGLQAAIPLADGPWLGAYQTGFLFAAVPEEAVKVAAIAWIASRGRDFDEPMDGVVYGTAVGLGFAALENCLYLFNEDSWGSVALVRGILSVPLHGAVGAIAGAFVARAHFAGILGSGHGRRWRRPRLMLLAWLVPTVMHGLFDGALFLLQRIPESAADTGEGAFAILFAVVTAPLAGFGTIIYAAVLTRRIAHRQAKWLSTRRLPPVHWRNAWAECLFSLGASCAAMPLVIAGEAGVRLVGAAVAGVAIWQARKCARTLGEVARGRHRAQAAEAA
jgi:RsiW-degrading membrane proteinase PrsW (M82 family)